GEVDAGREASGRWFGGCEIGPARPPRAALGPPVEHAAGGRLAEAAGEVEALACAQTERRAEPGPGPRRRLGLGEPRPLDGDLGRVEPHVATDAPEVLRRLGSEVEPDLGVDEGGSRQAALQIQKRHRVGKAEEWPAKADADPAVAERRDAQAGHASGWLRRPLTREEHQPTLGQEEEEPCPLGLVADEAAEPRARELEA